MSGGDGTGTKGESFGNGKGPSMGRGGGQGRGGGFALGPGGSCVCPNCGKGIDLFSEGGGEKAAKELGVPFLGRVPIDPRIVKSGDDGRPFILSQPDSEAAKAFEVVVENVSAQD